MFAGNLISRNLRLSDFFSFLQKLYVNQQLKQNQYVVQAVNLTTVQRTYRRNSVKIVTQMPKKNFRRILTLINIQS